MQCVQTSFELFASNSPGSVFIQACSKAFLSYLLLVMGYCGMTTLALDIEYLPIYTMSLDIGYLPELS